MECNLDALISAEPPMLIVQKQLPGLCHQPRLCQEPEWQSQHESANNIVHLAFVFCTYFSINMQGLWLCCIPELCMGYLWIYGDTSFSYSIPLFVCQARVLFNGDPMYTSPGSKPRCGPNRCISVRKSCSLEHRLIDFLYCSYTEYSLLHTQLSNIKNNV